jgi:dipeptidyl aminopeptidase/acylaminoacyl peptidase
MTLNSLINSMIFPDYITRAELSRLGGRQERLLAADERKPARAAIQISGATKDLAPDSIPADFPAGSLVAPQLVVYSASDGMSIHGQLFLPPNSRPGEKHPALVFMHGGSRRQMLPGRHYMDYYNNAYGMNQYLASLGYVVLSIITAAASGTACSSARL